MKHVKWDESKQCLVFDKPKNTALSTPAYVAPGETKKSKSAPQVITMPINNDLF